jgi:hypothetical protein
MDVDTASTALSIPKPMDMGVLHTQSPSLDKPASMHPLAGERPIATMDVDAAPAPWVPNMDMGALRTQLNQSPSLDKPAFMHPIATMDIDAASTAPSVPKPIDMEALSTQLHQSPSLDKPAEVSKNPDPIAARIHTLSGECSISPPIPKPINIPPPVQMSPSSSPSTAMLTVQQPNPAESTSVSHMSHGLRQMIQFSRKRRNDSSRVKAVRRDAHADSLGTDARVAVIEKTRLVEQLDLTTRKIINEKDERIMELQTQVRIY